MIKTEIHPIHFEADRATKKYAKRKLGNLDRYMNRKAASSARIEVKLIGAKKGATKYRCEAMLHIGGVQLTADESTDNMNASIDLVEAKLKNQLRRHKEKHSHHKADRKGVLRRFRRMADRDRLNEQE